VARTELRRVGDKLVLVYADARGAEAGVHARFLDADGRIASPAGQGSPGKAGGYYPPIASAPDGSYYYRAGAHQAHTHPEDPFLRKLGAGLEPASDVLRATDLVPSGPGKPRVKLPSMTIASDALLISFRLERDPARLIHHMRLPLADAAKGLEPLKKGERKT